MNDVSASHSCTFAAGAVDWNATVWLNTVQIASHSGGYSHFTADASANIKPTANELIVRAYDPSDSGYQVNGKQRISAITKPGGDTYTPTSGIWQTVRYESACANCTHVLHFM